MTTQAVNSYIQPAETIHGWLVALFCTLYIPMLVPASYSLPQFVQLNNYYKSFSVSYFNWKYVYTIYRCATFMKSKEVVNKWQVST